jgi:hypothetical protein
MEVVTKDVFGKPLFYFISHIHNFATLKEVFKTIFLYNRLGFVLGGSSFPSIHPFRHPSHHPSSSSLDEEDDGTGGQRQLMATVAFYFLIYFFALFRRAAQG